MKLPTLAMLALAFSAAAQAAPAGKVLVVAGNATLARAGQQLPLQAGATVESGDVLEVGDRSTLQVRFTDESVVALRANSQFKIEDYRFDKSADSDRSILGLLKGGMRTITGLIGKTNQKNYLVRTATATIGIRGTHFTVVSCNNDCRNPDGSQGLNGTFGGVTDGRITVSNNSGQREFGQQDFFHVPTADAAPVRLLAPPAILNDRGLAARGRSPTGSLPAEASGAAASAQTETRGRSPTGSLPAEASGAAASAQTENNSGTQTSTSPQLTVQSAPSVQLLAPLTQVAAPDQPNIVSSGSSNKITVVETRLASPTVIEANARDYSVLELRSEVSEISGVLFTNAATLAAAFQAIRPVGSSAAAAAYWMYEPPKAGSTALLGSHHAWGDTPQVALPGAGTAQYNYVGGTSPTDNYGRIGTFIGSNLLMDFSARQIKNSSAMTMGFGINALQTAPTVYSIPANTTWSMGGGPNPLAGATCPSGCSTVSTTAGAINGRFVGASLQGYTAAITVTNTQLTTGQANAAGGVAAFAKQ